MREPSQDQSWTLLKSIAIGRPGNDDWREAEKNIHVGEFDQDALLGHAVRHSLLETIAAFIANLEERVSLPNRTLKYLDRCLWANQVATTNCLDDAVEIRDALGREEVRFAFTKGIVCQQTIYDGSGARLFSDIDLMVHPDDASQTAEILVSLGFAEKQSYDRRTATLRPISKSRLAMYRLSPDHLPHFTRLNPNRVPRLTIVDVALSLTWHASPWQIPIDDALAELRTVRCKKLDGHADIPALRTELDLLFHLLHLFREGWFERTAVEKDVRLSQFADIVRAWGSLDSDSRCRFVDLIHNCGVEPPAAWTLHHVDAVFGTSIVEACGLSRYCTSNWTSSMSGRGGYKRWHGDMERRLQESRFALENLTGGLSIQVSRH